MPHDPLLLLLLSALGLIAGVLGGLLGIGGGLVIIPALLLTLGRPFGDGSLHVYKVAALATAIVLSIPAAWQHARAKAVIVRMLPTCEAFGVIGVILGVGLAALMSAERTIWLQRTFGVAMIASVASSLLLQRRSVAIVTQGHACPTPARWGLIGGVVGLPAGLVSGLLGIGGGLWAVPAFNRILHVRLPSAIANSTCMIVGIALTAAIAQSAAVARMPGLDWTNGWQLAAWLSPGALIGGWIGGRLTHVLPVALLRGAFQALLVVTGVRLLVG